MTKRTQKTKSGRAGKTGTVASRRKESVLRRMQAAKQAHSQRLFSLWNKEHVSTGRVLKCHLLVEYHLNEYLTTANPEIANWDELRLTFHQKLLMASGNLWSLNEVAKAIRELNSLRNRFSHDLNASINDQKLLAMKEVVKKWRKPAEAKAPMPSGIELVETFSLICCSYIGGYTASIFEALSKKNNVPLQRLKAAVRTLPQETGIL